MTLHSMIPLVPVLFAIHNAEEAPRMAAWSATVSRGGHPRVSTPQFTVAVVLLTLVVAAAAAWAYLDPDGHASLRVLLALQAAIGFNAILPHLALLLRQRRYNPGLLTAVLLTLPFSIWCFDTAVAEGKIGVRELATFALLAPVVMVAAALAALWVGALVTRSRAPGASAGSAGAA